MILKFLVDWIKSGDFSKAINENVQAYENVWNKVIDTLEDVTGADFRNLKSGNPVNETDINKVANLIKANSTTLLDNYQGELDDIANKINNLSGINVSIGSAALQNYNRKFRNKMTEQLQDRSKAVEKSMRDVEAKRDLALSNLDSAISNRYAEERNAAFEDAKNIAGNLAVEQPVKGDNNV